EQIEVGLVVVPPPGADELDQVGVRDHFCIPPDAEISSPVTNDDASLARYKTGPTISAGSAMRFIRVSSAMSCLKPGAGGPPPSVISLSNGPGARTLTRTPHCAHSCAMDFVRLTRAAFDAPYAQIIAPPEYAAIVAMLTMLPPPWSRMVDSTHWLIRSGPSTLTAKSLRQ